MEASERKALACERGEIRYYSQKRYILHLGLCLYIALAAIPSSAFKDHENHGVLVPFMTCRRLPRGVWWATTPL